MCILLINIDDTSLISTGTPPPQVVWSSGQSYVYLQCRTCSFVPIMRWSAVTRLLGSIIIFFDLKGIVCHCCIKLKKLLFELWNKIQSSSPEDRSKTIPLIICTAIMSSTAGQSSKIQTFCQSSCNIFTVPTERYHSFTEPAERWRVFTKPAERRYSFREQKERWIHFTKQAECRYFSTAPTKLRTYCRKQYSLPSIQKIGQGHHFSCLFWCLHHPADTVGMRMKQYEISTISPFVHSLIKPYCSDDVNDNAYVNINHSSESPSVYPSIKSYNKVDTGTDDNANSAAIPKKLLIARLLMAYFGVIKIIYFSSRSTF